MLKIEYEIKLNESGRPFIELSKDYEDKPEDKFFVMELSRYLLTNVYNRRSDEFDEETSSKIYDCLIILGQVSDEIAILIRNQMEAMGELSVVLNRNYDIQVENIEERNKLNHTNILYNNKIYVRYEGLRVLVTSDMKIYKLVGGIDNEFWVE